MVSVVSSNPTGGNFIFLRHLDANFVQNARNVRFVLFTKTSIDCLLQTQTITSRKFNYRFRFCLMAIDTDMNSLKDSCFGPRYKYGRMVFLGRVGMSGRGWEIDGSLFLLVFWEFLASLPSPYRRKVPVLIQVYCWISYSGVSRISQRQRQIIWQFFC